MNCTKQSRGYTFIEILAAVLVVGAGAGVYSVVAAKYGTGVGIEAGFLAMVASVLIVIQFYRWSWKRDKRRLEELREKYQTIYRVIALPEDEGNLRKAAGAEIKIGDYGWEAGPLRKDGLIYLQGLTPEWNVVWHAGFRPEQIEKVAAKPVSQYDRWRPYWLNAPLPPPCPFPILARVTATMGLPHHSHAYFNYPATKPAN